MSADRSQPGEDEISVLIEANLRIVEAFNSGGIEHASEYFDLDIELYDPDMPDEARMRGREEVTRTLGALIDAFDTMEVQQVEMFPVGNRVVSLIRTAAIGEGSLGEMRVEFHNAHVTTVRGGKVAYWRIYHDVREAFEDVGLDPERPGEPAYRFERG